MYSGRTGRDDPVVVGHNAVGLLPETPAFLA